MPTVRESFAHCRQVARTRARNFYYSFLLLPRERKEAMCAIYAFMRYADDISDQPDPPRETRVVLLDRWRKAFQISLQGEYGNDPILPALHETVRKYAIPSEYFSDLIDGVRSDLSTTCYRTFDDLYRYCYRVASVVGMTTVHSVRFRLTGGVAVRREVRHCFSANQHPARHSRGCPARAVSTCHRRISTASACSLRTSRKGVSVRAFVS